MSNKYSLVMNSIFGHYFLILFSIFCPNTLSGQDLPDSPINNEGTACRSINYCNGLESKLNIDNLQLKIRVQRPLTVPSTSAPDSWIISGEKTDKYKLFGQAGELTTVSYKTNNSNIDCQVWTSETNSFVAFRQIITNTSQRTLLLESLIPLFVSGGQDLNFGRISDWIILEQYRHKNDQPKSETPEPGKKITCDPFLIINSDKGEGKNLLIGSQTFNYHLSEISITFDGNLGLNNIVAKCDFESVEVPKDGMRSSQWFVISLEDNVHKQISEYTDRVLYFHNVNPPSEAAPAVYCTWYYHALNYNEEIFRKDIGQFKKERIPFDVFLIDECWDVDDWGDFEANKSFPSGMKWAAEQIRSAGYIPGIWTAPFLVDPGSDVMKNHHLWLLKNSRGELCKFRMNDKDHYILDLTFPGVCDYLEEQFRKISRDWGYEYFKFDFMRAVFLDTDQQFFDKSATSLEAYRKGLESIRRGVGNNAYISVCGGHYGASLGIANSQRSGSDVKSRWDESEIPKYRQNILRTWMSSLWHVDPDAMMVRRQSTTNPGDREDLVRGLFTDDEAFTNALNQFVGGNLVTFTEDFSIIDNDRKMLYKHVIPSVNSASLPIDIFNPGCPEFFLTKITPRAGVLAGWNMITLINWNDNIKDYRISLDKKMTEGLKGNNFLIFDFRKQDVIGYFGRDEMLTIENVNGHESRLIKIIPWDGRSSVFLGTDLSFSCGGTEIDYINFKNSTISGEIDTPWFVPVNLTFLVPSGNGFEKVSLTVSSGQRRFWLNY